jgi:hypothetical protein
LKSLMAHRSLQDAVAVGKLGSAGAADCYPYPTTHPYPALNGGWPGMDGRPATPIPKMKLYVKLLLVL